MATELELVNDCLTHIGKLPVTAVAESDASRYMAIKLANILPEILRRTNWIFARKYNEDNTPLVTNIAPDYTYNYQMPGDYGHFDRWSFTLTATLPYEFMNDILMTNIKPIRYFYIAKKVDYSVLSPMFERALTYYAAMESALFLTQSPTVEKKNEIAFELALTDAIFQNDKQQPIISAPYNGYDRRTYV